MAKGKDFKKPVNNEEEVINEEEEKNKRLIIIVCLSIIVVLGLIIASISYFNSRDVEDDKKDKNNDKNKPIEVVNPPVVDKKDDEEAKPNQVVHYTVNRKPNNTVAVAPGEDEEEKTPVISSVNENDYTVTIVGNTAMVSGVSRYVAADNNGNATNVVVLRIMLDSKYTKEELEDILRVTTTLNNVSDNAFDFEILGEAGNYYFDWVRPVGNGYEKPTQVTIKYGNESETVYNINLNGLRVESESSEEEIALVEVPSEEANQNVAFSGIKFPYEVAIYRQLTEEEIEWLESEIKEPVLPVQDEQSGETPDQDKDEEVKEPDYSKDLYYTVKFDKLEEETDNTGSGDSLVDAADTKYKNLRVVKVYAPVLKNEDGTIKEIKLVEEKFVVTGIENTEEGPAVLGTFNTEVVYKVDEKGDYLYEQDEFGNDKVDSEGNKVKIVDYTRYYTYLGYYADETESETETVPNHTFTIDWDGEDGTDYGKYTYEFDVNGLKDEEVDNTLETNEEESGPQVLELDEEIPEEVEQPLEEEIPSVLEVPAELDNVSEDTLL